jgi:hypothetical protein
MATSGTKVPSIYTVPSSIDPQLKNYMVSIQEAVEVRLGRRGDPKDRAITLRELIDSGLAEELLDNPFDPNAGTGVVDFKPRTVVDTTIPPVPTGVAASAAFTSVVVSWDAPQFSNFAFAEIYRGTSNSISAAVLADTTTANVWSDSADYDQTFYYWVRFVSTSDIRGPFANSVNATTAEDIAAVMTSLSQTLADLPGYNLLATSTTAATIIKSSSQPSTRANGDALQPNDIWFDTDDGQIYTRNTANNAWVAGRDATLVNLFGSTSFTGSTLTAAMATAQSDIVTVTNEQSSTASSLTSLTSTVGTNTSSISTLNTTTASHTGDLNAMFVLQVATESNGSKSAAGMVIGSNASSGSGAQSYVQFQADKFAIWSGSAAVAPFIIDSGVVYIDTARIKDASIASAKIGSLAVDKLTGSYATFSSVMTGTLSGTEITANTVTLDRLNFVQTGATDNATIEVNGSGASATLKIRSDGIVIDHIGPSQLGRIASVDNLNQSYTQSSSNMSVFTSSSPVHLFVTTDKFGIPTGTTYMGGSSSGQIQLNILGNTIKETGTYVVTVMMQTSGSSTSSSRSGFAVNITESTNSSAVSTDHSSSFFNMATGEMTGNDGFHLTPKLRQEQVTFTAGRSYQIAAFFYGSGIGNAPGGSTPSVSSYINVSRINEG